MNTSQYKEKKGTLEDMLAQLVLRKIFRRLFQEYENTIWKPTEIQNFSDVIAFLEYPYSTQNSIRESPRHFFRSANWQHQSKVYNSINRNK